MNRFFINLLAVVTIMVGGWLVLRPAPASAGDDDDRACCENYKGKCCGDSCGFDPESGYCHAEMA